VRSVVAEAEAARAFGGRRAREAGRPGAPAAGLSARGDGAEGARDIAGAHPAGAARVPGVYHGREHPAKAAGAAPPAGEALRGWRGGAPARPIGGGYWGVCEALAGPGADARRAARLGAAAAEVLDYFGGHRGGRGTRRGGGGGRR